MRDAFKDEFFKNLKVKSGYHGFLAALTASIIVILASLAMQFLSVDVRIPACFVGEAVLLAGIATNDISLILSVRG